ncbi:MAG: cupin domain-containing protein [Parachlamydia sp.]|nr:cupin domain-containing protein [Parachlamydia sp.]
MHHFRFSAQSPQNQTDHGYRILATKSNFPILKNMSLYKLVLNPQALREPHWHANADELGYCTKGEMVISLYANGNEREKFLISAGQAFFIPSGSLHSLENSGKEQAELILQFSSDEPEDFGLSSVINMFSDEVLGNTWGMPASYFSSLQRSPKEAFIAQLPLPGAIEKVERYVSKYQYALEESSPLISNGGGSAKVARQNVWPVLKRQALYSLTLTQQGMREPHWHPETAELGYVSSGEGRMSILSPDGKVDTYTMAAGDIYFIPKAYPHHIENLANEDLKILIFFDQAMPQDIGFTGSVKSNSNAALAAILNTSPSFFDKLPAYYEDLFIVDKINPEN